MSRSTETRYVLEQRSSFVAAMTGFVALGIAVSAFFAWFALQALGLTTNVDGFGVTGLGATLLASVIISRVLAGRLLGYTFVTVASMMAFIGRLIPGLDGLDPERAEEYCNDGNPTMAAFLGVLSLQCLAFFAMGRWTCGTANPDGGFMNATCTFYDPGPFRELLLHVLRLVWSGFGIAGVLLLVAFLLELRFLWRGSIIREWYRSSSAYYWLHPVESFYRDLEPDENDADE